MVKARFYIKTERIWGQLKDYTRKRNIHGKLKITKELVYEAIGQISAHNWSKAINHSIKQENLYAFHDKIDSYHEEFENDQIRDISSTYDLFLLQLKYLHRHNKPLNLNL